MRIYLGEEFDPTTNAKVFCIRSNFDKDQYRIIEEGFLINEYYVDFFDDKHATLFLLKYSQ